MHRRQHHNRERVVDEWVAWLAGCLGGFGNLLIGSAVDGRSICCFVRSISMHEERGREGDDHPMTISV